eukprot:CAMPEP_0172672248 /NCGR_PEP_ID=MMETSP1074-20121228/11429_1 /TAXON_ID=2916 /ORGANISM="Ceratium fusus, Strain PA161109" /LENGTH=205 /DNA_ID=CAMNT_0013489407 /DNA_START=186 /DNA_END=800 /DNA_ORIENTATION=-
MVLVTTVPTTSKACTTANHTDPPPAPRTEPFAEAAHDNLPPAGAVNPASLKGICFSTLLQLSPLKHTLLAPTHILQSCITAPDMKLGFAPFASFFADMYNLHSAIVEQLLDAGATAAPVQASQRHLVPEPALACPLDMQHFGHSLFEQQPFAPGFALPSHVAVETAVVNRVNAITLSSRVDDVEIELRPDKKHRNIVAVAETRSF